MREISTSVQNFIARHAKAKRERRPIRRPFGEILRASRTRWGWAFELGAWVRITQTSDRDHARVEIRADGDDLGGGASGEAHTIWWEEEDQGDAIIRSIHPLREMIESKRAVTGSHVFVIDMQGRRV